MILLLFTCLFIFSAKTEQHEIVVINFQGTKFETTRQTLYKIPYFRNYINLDNSNSYFMDRSAHIFKHILAWAVDSNYPFPHRYKNEAIFFDINFENITFYNDLEITCY